MSLFPEKSFTFKKAFSTQLEETENLFAKNKSLQLINKGSSNSFTYKLYHNISPDYWKGPIWLREIPICIYDNEHEWKIVTGGFKSVPIGLKIIFLILSVFCGFAIFYNPSINNLIAIGIFLAFPILYAFLIYKRDMKVWTKLMNYAIENREKPTHNTLYI